MKVSEFVKALQEMPQDAEITFTVGFNDEQRQAYAFAVSDSNVPELFKHCLEDMEPCQIIGETLLYSKEQSVEVVLDDSFSGNDSIELEGYYQEHISHKDGEQPKEA